MPHPTCFLPILSSCLPLHLSVPFLGRNMGIVTGGLSVLIGVIIFINYPYREVASCCPLTPSLISG